MCWIYLLQNVFPAASWGKCDCMRFSFASSIIESSLSEPLYVYHFGWDLDLRSACVCVLIRWKKIHNSICVNNIGKMVKLIGMMMIIIITTKIADEHPFSLCILASRDTLNILNTHTRPSSRSRSPNLSSSRRHFNIDHFAFGDVLRSWMFVRYHPL